MALRALAFLSLVSTTGLMGQSFEVASVKPTVAFGRVTTPVAIDQARATFSAASLASLIVRAYRVRSFQLSGPTWINSARFEIAAKLPDGSSPGQVPEMLRSLLEERFKLTLHSETREFPVYALVVGKDGPKLPPRQPDNQPGETPTDAMTLSAFTEQLTLDRPVIDQTELNGAYVFPVDEYHKLTDRAIARAKDSVRAGSPVDPEGWVTDAMFSAAKEILSGLGLKLEPRKLPLPYLVVDHLEKVPVEN